MYCFDFIVQKGNVIQTIEYKCKHVECDQHEHKPRPPHEAHTQDTQDCFSRAALSVSMPDEPVL